MAVAGPTKPSAHLSKSASELGRFGIWHTKKGTAQGQIAVGELNLESRVQDDPAEW